MRCSTRAVGKLFAWPLENLFQFLFGALKLLLVEQAHGLFIEFHLRLHAGVNHFHTTPLRRRRRQTVLFL